MANLKQAAEKAAAATEELKQEALKAAELAKTEHQALLARLTALETATATPSQTAQTARLTDKVYLQCNLTVLYTDGELPAMKPPDKETKKHLSLIATNLTAWGQQGMVPLTFGQLLSGTLDEQVPAAFKVLMEVTGETIWVRYFAKGNVNSEDYVPFQLGTVLSAGLLKVDSALTKYKKEFDYLERAR